MNRRVKPFAAIALLSGAAWLVWALRPREPRSGELCDPTVNLPDGWTCTQRAEDGAYVVTPTRSGEACDPLALEVPGYVCVPYEAGFVLRPAE